MSAALLALGLEVVIDGDVASSIVEPRVVFLGLCLELVAGCSCGDRVHVQYTETNHVIHA